VPISLSYTTPFASMNIIGARCPFPYPILPPSPPLLSPVDGPSGGRRGGGSRGGALADLLELVDALRLQPRLLLLLRPPCRRRRLRLPLLPAAVVRLLVENGSRHVLAVARVKPLQLLELSPAAPTPSASRQMMERLPRAGVAISATVRNTHAAFRGH
jgi:hypothetical protein